MPPFKVGNAEFSKACTSCQIIGVLAVESERKKLAKLARFDARVTSIGVRRRFRQYLPLRFVPGATATKETQNL
jgi:hypothetical protein